MGILSPTACKSASEISEAGFFVREGQYTGLREVPSETLD